MTTRVTITGEFCSTADEAIDVAKAEGRKAIYCQGCNIVVTKTEARRLEATGVFMAYLARHDGRVVTVPVN